MAKIFKTSDDVAEFIESKFDETNLTNYGITLNVMSVTKAKDLLKLQKASATTEFLTKGNGSNVHVYVYEALFDRLPDLDKNLLVEMALSNISYDSEKDKITIDTNPFNQIIRMRKKHGDIILDKIETCQLLIEAMEEEEKEQKAAEKEARKSQK